LKRVICGELVPGCAFQARANSVSEALHVWAGHARSTHGMNVSELLDRARASVEEVPAPSGEERPAV
jgi:predicted small metal-binding protein